MSFTYQMYLIFLRVATFSKLDEQIFEFLNEVLWKLAFILLEVKGYLGEDAVKLLVNAFRLIEELESDDT